MSHVADRFEMWGTKQNSTRFSDAAVLWMKIIGFWVKVITETGIFEEKMASVDASLSSVKIIAHCSITQTPTGQS